MLVVPWFSILGEITLFVLFCLYSVRAVFLFFYLVCSNFSILVGVAWVCYKIENHTFQIEYHL